MSFLHITVSTKHSCTLFRDKRHFVFFTAFATDNFCHLPATHAFRFSLGTTICTSKWRVFKAFLLIKFLLTSCPNKLFTTVFAD